jgi:hypothetical protein
LVIETTVVGLPKPLLISSTPTALGPDEGNGSLDLNGCTIDECVTALYGLVAVPDNVTRPAWVVSQFTNLGQLRGHKLHHVHKCAPASAVPANVQRVVDEGLVTA